MKETLVTLRSPETLLRAAQQLARERDESVGHVVRQAIAAEIKRNSRIAKTPNRADELLLGPLRALLASDLAQATSWPDLAARLSRKGFAMREAGGGLALHASPDGARLCKASELGASYSQLMRRFGKPFPNHAHHWLTDRVLGPTRNTSAPRSTR